MQAVPQQIERLKKIYSKSTDTALANAMSVSKNTISGWKKRNAIPMGFLSKVAQNEGVSIEWLLSGKGKMKQTDLELLEYDMTKIEQVFNNQLDPKILKSIADNENLQKLISLFAYAPEEFILQIIKRLEQFKEMSRV
ncbi:MAG: helix-turn-helix domain-containing protein [Sulfurimonas sp.]|uniref:helix-turn-helix domain-containing protein n=1 Tax=Sulfurimonas sp. TaxID=2022749 RepID=UPI0028CFBA81|nr:helix-turn-helix domain-containing protein [Sulfurimonas sp.]MDT8338554.1 helix-turn-helix domain-containing protein [Sulfurimonas sp.]